MMYTIFQFGISNATIACLLAIVAFGVGVCTNHPKLTHLLWVLVLVKLVTPPIFNVPLPLSATPSESVATGFVSDIEVQDATVEIVDHVHNESEIELGNLASGEVFSASVWNTTKLLFGVAWLLGTIVVLLVSIARVVRFHLLLKRSTQQAGRKLLTIGERVAEQLGQQRMPIISTTTANVSPMVWWVGGDVKIVLPQSLMDEMSDEQCRLILAHEMAHVCRRDYLVRWLEWLARVAFWWNPIVWWAQRNLRAVEEICCDELVLRKLNPNAKSYANTILTTVESLVSPVIRPPAVASEIDSGGFLERRIEMIMTRELIQQPTRRLSVLVVYFALLVIPFGFVNAQDTDQEHQQGQTAEQEVAVHDPDHDGQHKAIEELGQELKEAVKSGTMSESEAMAALSEANRKHREDNKHTERVVDYEAMKRHRRSEIKHLVAEGELTKEQGHVKLMKMIEDIELFQSKSQLEAEVETLVEAGKLTKHEAKVKVITQVSEIQMGKSREKANLAKVKIEKALNAGEITAEQAKTKLVKLGEDLEVQVGALKRQEVFLKEEADIAQRMETGKMSKEQAHKRLMDLVGQEIDRAIKADKITAQEGSAQLKRVSETVRENLERKSIEVSQNQ